LFLGLFTQLNLEPPVLQAIEEMGFEETTPIQDLTIPRGLEGRDLIGRAQTGTGKTAAYGIPLIQNCDSSPELQGLVLTPTRELAVQVAEELNRIGQFKRIRSLPIYGGQEINWQIKALKKKPQVVVATPGRLLDHLRRRTIRLDEIKTLVLDEADEMLNMGFIDDIELILDAVPISRQTMMFSATIPDAIKTLAAKFMREPELLSVKSREVTVPSIVQQYLEVPEGQKFDVLCRLLDLETPEAAIVFARTKKRVDELAAALDKRGYSVEALHGDLSQSRRTAVLRRFKEGMVEILVATDVAARGLDITGVTHVYNFDIPQDPELFVHRIGRTGRAGKSGLAVTLVTPRERGLLRSIEQVISRKIERRPVPTAAEALEGQQRIAAERLLNVVLSGDFALYQPLAEELLQEYDSNRLLAAALKLLTKESVPETAIFTEEPRSMPRGEKRPPRKSLPRSVNRNQHKNRY